MISTARARVWALAALLMASPASFAAAPNLKVGDTPPELFRKDVNGEAVHLADYQGKALIIPFWASWCPPCRKELPMLLEVQKQATRNQLLVLSVNIDENYDNFIAVKRLPPQRWRRLAPVVRCPGTPASGRKYQLDAVSGRVP